MKFSEIVGHDAAKMRLVQMVQQKRLPHALLLSGPVGSGEMMLARAFVQYLHCTGRAHDDVDSCGCCPSCRQHQAFNHVDLHFVFPVLKKGSGVTISDDYLPEWREYLSADSWMDFRKWPAMLGKTNGQPTIYVDDADNLQRKMSLTARASDINVALIWLPERMQQAAANKLLKLLEEPEEGSLFLLVSNAPAEILPTIYSRCQRLELRRLSDEAVATVVGSGLNPTDVMAAAHVAEGNVIAARDALAATDAGGNFNFFIDLMRKAYARKVGELKVWSEKVNELGRDGICRFLEYAQRMVRENFILNLKVAELNYLNTQEAQFSERFCPFINERNVEQLIAEFDSAIVDIRGNGSGKIVLFDMAVKVIILLRA